MKTSGRFLDPKRGIDWDVFNVGSDERPILQVQRVTAWTKLSDDDAVECARKSGIDCDDRGYVISMGANE